MKIILASEPMSAFLLIKEAGLYEIRVFFNKEKYLQEIDPDNKFQNIGNPKKTCIIKKTVFLSNIIHFIFLNYSLNYFSHN